MKKGNWKDAYLHFVKTGGVSYNTDTHEINPTTGYMVGLDKSLEQMYPIPKNEQEFNDTVKDFVIRKVNAAHRAFYNHPNLFFGFWINKGILYVDMVENIQDRNEAIRLGKEREQLAIWDCVEDKSIDVRILMQMATA